MALILLILSAFPAYVWAQTPTSTGTAPYSESGVPTGKPVVGQYNGALRPQIHYSPPTGFMVSRQTDNSFECYAFLGCSDLDLLCALDFSP